MRVLACMLGRDTRATKERKVLEEPGMRVLASTSGRTTRATKERKILEMPGVRAIASTPGRTIERQASAVAALISRLTKATSRNASGVVAMGRALRDMRGGLPTMEALTVVMTFALTAAGSTAKEMRAQMRAQSWTVFNKMIISRVAVLEGGPLSHTKVRNRHRHSSQRTFPSQAAHPRPEPCRHMSRMIICMQKCCQNNCLRLPLNGNPRPRLCHPHHLQSLLCPLCLRTQI
jgi:hypothetical protein